MTNFNEMTVPELRALCKERGDITGYSRMRKADLIDVLTVTVTESPVVVMATGNANENSETFQVIDFGPTMPENLNRKQRRMWIKRQKIKASNPNKNLRVAFS